MPSQAEVLAARVWPNQGLPDTHFVEPGKTIKIGFQTPYMGYSTFCVYTDDSLGWQTVVPKMIRDEQVPHLFWPYVRSHEPMLVECSGESGRRRLVIQPVTSVADLRLLHDTNRGVRNYIRTARAKAVILGPPEIQEQVLTKGDSAMWKLAAGLAINLRQSNATYAEAMAALDTLLKLQTHQMVAVLPSYLAAAAEKGCRKALRQQTQGHLRFLYPMS